jgi:uncharacterized membrane protein
MPSIHVEAVIDAAPDKVWDVIGDWEQGPVRMAPGFVVSSIVDGDARVVTFANGAVARERFVTRDEGRKRLVWNIVGGPTLHHNGVMEVHEAPTGQTRLTWTADVLPAEVAATYEGMMQNGMSLIAKTLGG